MSGSLRKVKTRSQEANIKRILQDKRKRIRLFLLVCGILLVVLGFYLSKVPVSSDKNKLSNTSVTDEVSSFSQEPVKVDKSLLESRSNKDKNKNPPIRILIPDLDIDLPVREAQVVKGYWEVFPDVAGFGLGSSYPDEIGNQVIFAHARRGLFLPLKNAKVGQLIYIFTKDRWFSYKIDGIKEILPSQIEVLVSTKEPILTLYTCSGFADSKRLIVTAKKI